MKSPSALRCTISAPSPEIACRVDPAASALSLRQLSSRACAGRRRAAGRRTASADSPRSRICAAIVLPAAELLLLDSPVAELDEQHLPALVPALRHTYTKTHTSQPLHHRRPAKRYNSASVPVHGPKRRLRVPDLDPPSRLQPKKKTATPSPSTAHTSRHAIITPHQNRRGLLELGNIDPPVISVPHQSVPGPHAATTGTERRLTRYLSRRKARTARNIVQGTPARVQKPCSHARPTPHGNREIHARKGNTPAAAGTRFASRIRRLGCFRPDHITHTWKNVTTLPPRMRNIQHRPQNTQGRIQSPCGPLSQLETPS
jgi:hypothetical protein